MTPSPKNKKINLDLTDASKSIQEPEPEMQNLSTDELLEVFEETADLIEADSANNLNLC